MEIANSLPCRLTVKGIVERIERRVNRQLPAWQKLMAESPVCLGETEQETLAFGAFPRPPGV